jgi:predicted Rossmann-fold nucleotide-binding protein
MAGRLERFAGADAFIFFTGGIGTLSEFAFIWHTRATASPARQLSSSTGKRSMIRRS